MKDALQLEVKTSASRSGNGKAKTHLTMMLIWELERTRMYLIELTLMVTKTISMMEAMEKVLTIENTKNPGECYLNIISLRR